MPNVIGFKNIFLFVIINESFSILLFGYLYLIYIDIIFIFITFSLVHCSVVFSVSFILDSLSRCQKDI